LKELEAKSLESKNHPIPENERFIAEYMHDKTCKSSHEDQCDWLYDKGDWSMHSRKHYLEKAKNMTPIEGLVNRVRAVMELEELGVDESFYYQAAKILVAENKAEQQYRTDKNMSALSFIKEIFRLEFALSRYWVR